ncbi:MAG TPA: anthranilate synthase component I [Methylomirabilota bacterium]
MITEQSSERARAVYTTRGGVRIERTIEALDAERAIEPVLRALDTQRGVLLASSYEYPGRYTRWDLGFVDPPLEISGRRRTFAVTARNARGRVLLPAIARALVGLDTIAALEHDADALHGEVRAPGRALAEEMRSRQPSLFSVVRAVLGLFESAEDPHLGLYGAFGYDLGFQFEPVRVRLPRPPWQRDLVLYLPDDLVVVDHRRGRAERRRYEFQVDGRTTAGLAREGERAAPAMATGPAPDADHARGAYAALVGRAREAFARGDLFEVVLSQTFTTPCAGAPSEIFRRVQGRNPSPYGLFVNLGEAEYLVGASPEMYVRVDGDRVETCPISGTIARGHDALSDAAQILTLLNSAKDEAELTMCTDVDRNDKSRICVPGSVRVIGRRQIEMASRVIHTVDHVEGRLRPEFDALDAFLTHTWAVTVTGAPKAWAMQFIEDHEASARGWYGGAVGVVGFDGSLNTGLTLRTIHLREGLAHVRVGATLLWDSDPDAEEVETRMKAAAFLDAIREPRAPATAATASGVSSGIGRRILLVDHQDSFVHTLGNYLRQTGATVVTWRAGFSHAELASLAPDLVVLSPGPGWPRDFDVAGTIQAAVSRALPVFGVCLGLQGIVEHFGGELAVLDTPVHGKPSPIRVLGGTMFAGLPRTFAAGRYHSLFAVRETLPAVLTVCAESEDGVVMAIEHAELPISAVQFHPESILTAADEVGLRLLDNVVAACARPPRGAARSGGVGAGERRR